MRSVNDGGDGVQWAIFCHQIRYSVLRLGYSQLNCWQRGSHGNPQVTQAVAKAMVAHHKLAAELSQLRTIPTRIH